MDAIETNESAEEKVPQENPISGTLGDLGVFTAWERNNDYFQTGKKQGQLKPRAAGKGKKIPDNVGGLDIESLRATPTNNDEIIAQPDKKAEKKAVAAEKKIVEAKIAARLVMRALDMITNWVSKGQYGSEFNDAQIKARSKYRAELERDWEDYLATLDIPLHPALVVAFGSIVYVQDAFNTDAGKERAATIKEKIIGKFISGLFSRGK